MRLPLFCVLVLSISTARLAAQDNYEIQVYASETQEKATTMFELHSNVTVWGFKQGENGVIADDLAWHETIEITQGITSWFEIGAYLFMSANKGNYGLTYVGDHLRPRIRVPESWHCPVGLSLSVEAGYQKPRFCEDTWTLEIRPIIDRDTKWVYISLNPVVDYSFQGYNHHAGPQFSPDVKVEFHVTKAVGIGLEYYGGYGSFTAPYAPPQQFQQLGLAVDLDVSPEWELNFGYMAGLTPGTEYGIVKMILGRKVSWKKKTATKPIQ